MSQLALILYNMWGSSNTNDMLFHYHKQLRERITQIEHIEAKVDGLYYNSKGKKKK